MVSFGTQSLLPIQSAYRIRSRRNVGVRFLRRPIGGSGRLRGRFRYEAVAATHREATLETLLAAPIESAALETFHAALGVDHRLLGFNATRAAATSWRSGWP